MLYDDSAFLELTDNITLNSSLDYLFTNVCQFNPVGHADPERSRALELRHEHVTGSTK